MAPFFCSPVVPFSPFSSPSPFSVSSPAQESSQQQYRVLEVEVVSGGSRDSAKLWVYHGDTFVAKVNNVRGSDSAWKHKFVFAVTDDFLADKDSSLLVDIYTRPILGILKKKNVGTARCCIKDVLMGMEDVAAGDEVTFCTIPVVPNEDSGISKHVSSSLNLKLKLRLWKEVLQYIAPIH